MASNSYYSGGFSSYLSYQPVIGTGPTAPYGVGATSLLDDDSSSKKGSSDKRGKGTFMEGIDEYRNKLLVEHGLDNEVALFLEDMESAIEYSFDPFTGLPNMLAYKTLILGMNKLLNNKNEYDKAYESLQTKKTLDEIALSSSGEVYTYDSKTGSIKADLLNNIRDISKVHLLTNGELAYFRRHHPGLVNNNLVTLALANSISMDDITNSLQKAINGLGSDKVSADGMTLRDAQTLKAGIEYLQSLSPGLQQQAINGMSLAGIYRMNHATEAQLAQANYALAWLESVGLEPKMKLLLQAKAKQHGVGVHDLLATFINSKLKNESALNIESFTGDGTTGGKTSGSKDDSETMTASLQWLAGFGDRELVVFQKGTQDAMSVSSNVLGVTSRGYNVGFTKLSNVASSDFGGMFKWDQVTMADERIPTANLGNIVVDGEALYKMDLPIDLEAAAKGVTKPDFKWLSKIEEAENLIDLKGVRGDFEAENKIYEDLKIPVKYINGSKELTARYATFGVFNGYSHRDIFGKDNLAIDTTLIGKIDDDFTLQLILTAINEGLDSKDRVKLPSDGWFSFGKKNPAVFESCVFIPIRNNYFNANLGNKNDPSDNTARKVINPLMLQDDRLGQLKIGQDIPE